MSSERLDGRLLVPVIACRDGRREANPQPPKHTLSLQDDDIVGALDPKGDAQTVVMIDDWTIQIIQPDVAKAAARATSGVGDWRYNTEDRHDHPFGLMPGSLESFKAPQTLCTF